MHAAVCNCWLWRIGCCLASISERKHPKCLSIFVIASRIQTWYPVSTYQIFDIFTPVVFKEEVKFFFSFTVCSFRHDCNCNIFHAVYNNGESGRCVVSRWGWTRQMCLLGAKQTRDKERPRKDSESAGILKGASSLISSHRQHPRPLGLPAISR